MASSEDLRRDGDGTIYSIPFSGSDFYLKAGKAKGETFAVLDNEEIFYHRIQDSTDGQGLRTPLRGYNNTTATAHSSGDKFYKPAFDGLTRGALGTTATNWRAGEDIQCISFDAAEIWVTD